MWTELYPSGVALVYVLLIRNENMEAWTTECRLPHAPNRAGKAEKIVRESVITSLDARALFSVVFPSYPTRPDLFLRHKVSLRSFPFIYNFPLKSNSIKIPVWRAKKVTNFHKVHNWCSPDTTSLWLNLPLSHCILWSPLSLIQEMFGCSTCDQRYFWIAICLGSCIVWQCPVLPSSTPVWNCFSFDLDCN